MPDCPVTRVRSTCRDVTRQATQVRINYAPVAEYALGLPYEQLQAPGHHPQRHYLGQGADTAAFFVTLNTINFGSGYFPHLRKRPGMSGYYTIASCLTEYYQRHGTLTALDLAAITPVQCATLFRQDSDNAPVMELMHLFSRAWQELGNMLLTLFDGSFTHLIEAAEHRALNLVTLLTGMPAFQDQAVYRGDTVYFYKRAQLMAADLALAFNHQDWGNFCDLDQLTIFADNLVPHVLRLDGILDYTPELAAHIDTGEMLLPGSEAEIEIRAGALHAVECMREALYTAGQPFSSMQLDYLLWNRGQQPSYKLAKPRHRTRCMFY